MRILWLLVVCLSLLVSAPVFAQTFRASVLAGMNISQIDGDELLGFHQPGVNAGIRVVALLSDRWRVGPEILFSQQGARRNRNSFNVSPFDRFRLQTVEVPFMVYYHDWRLTAEAGVSYQRMIDYAVDDSGGNDITTTTNLNDNLLAIKVGVTFFVTERWGFNFRWSKHLLDIDRNDELAPTLKGRTISLRAVYTFGRGETIPRNLDSDR